MSRRYLLWIAALLLAAPLLAIAAHETKSVEDMITYPKSWGPSLLDPKIGGEIVEVSSNGTEESGTKTLNDRLVTEGHYWEPIWREGDSYVIVRLGHIASVARIQFTHRRSEEGEYLKEVGYPKSVKITALDEDERQLDEPRSEELENNGIQVARLKPPLKPAKLLRFDFGVDTYNVKRELGIGEIAVFEGEFYLGFQGLLPGTAKYDRIKFVDGDQIYGNLTFLNGKIVIQPLKAENPPDLERSDVYGIRWIRPPKGVPTAQVFLRTGEIVTGKMEMEGVEFAFGGVEPKPRLDVSRVTDIGLARRGKEKRDDNDKEIQSRGVIELVSGDRFIVKTEEVGLDVEPVTPSLVIGGRVKLGDVNRIEPVKQPEGMHRFVYKTREIVFARLKPGEPAGLSLELLAREITLQVLSSNIESYRAIADTYEIPSLPVDILALRNGDLVIGNLLEPKVKLQTRNFGEIELDSNSVAIIRSESEHPGLVEIRLVNGSVIHGRLKAESLKFVRRLNKKPFDIKPENLGLLNRFSEKRLNALRTKLGKDERSDDLTEVALYIFFGDKMRKNLRAVLQSLKDRHLWTFEQVPRG